MAPVRYNANKLVNVLRKVRRQTATLYSDMTIVVHNTEQYTYNSYKDALDDFQSYLKKNIQKKIDLGWSIVHIPWLFILANAAYVRQSDIDNFHSLDNDSLDLPNWCLRKGYRMNTNIQTNDSNDLGIMCVTLIESNLLTD